MNVLTVSNIERQNVLNNRYAVDALQENLGFTGMLFEGEYRFTKKMVADFYEVDLSTIDRYISQYADELKYNGYVLSKGKQLKEFKLQFAHVINEASKTTQLRLFNFRAVLNMGFPGQANVTDETLETVYGVLKKNPEENTWESDIKLAPNWIRKILINTKNKIKENEQVD